MRPLKLSLELPPSLNHSYRNVRGVGRVLTADARAYKLATVLMVTVAARRARFAVPDGARLSLALAMYFPSLDRRRDLSNHVKLVEDSIAAALGFDDSRIDHLVVARALPDSLGPRCEVVLRVLP